MKIKYKIWNENCKKDKEEYAYLKLQEEKGEIGLKFVDKNGINCKDGTILILSSQFRYIILCNGIDENLPIKTDLYEAPLFIHEKEVIKQQESDFMQTIKKMFIKEEEKKDVVLQ